LCKRQGATQAISWESCHEYFTKHELSDRMGQQVVLEAGLEVLQHRAA
jgi:hypothetical protein